VSEWKKEVKREAFDLFPLLFVQQQQQEEEEEEEVVGIWAVHPASQPFILLLHRMRKE
jgi:hypothetical protein